MAYIVYHYLTDKMESWKDTRHQHDETKKMEDNF